MRFPEMHTFRICVTKHKRNHNHKLSKKIFENYPSSRKVTDPDVLDLVEELIKVGDKPKKILKYLQETTGKRIILRDVHNLVQRIKAKCRGSGTVEDRLEAVLRKFCSNRGNTATVLIDDAKRTQTITIQTRQMKSHAGFDSGTNASKYKLFSFMIDDVFGHGQYVQHAPIENESHASMSKAVYEGRNAVNVDGVEDAVDLMVKAQDDKEYDRGLRYMYYLLDGFGEKGELPEPKHPLLVYFMRNWDACKDMWAVYERGHVAHLGSHTNNRLESAWGDLKQILRPEMELDECVETLILLQSTGELEYTSQFHVVGSRHYRGADDVLLRSASLVSPHAFNLVQWEYELFKGGVITYTCSCFFMRTMLLPCHHTIFVRSKLKKNTNIFGLGGSDA
ncbi:hypothetical protein F444_17511 [Phytophthora nicotianae P1976]|uniref:ZSWIM1/3 RNaseH-like domain-containing protein n=1 Tax=Phytophthora nicotianae P1976 TaxID=1317066 RepID=A0A080ZES1_PHYNI|nr:hypothetical protein F444_17511 [Phytophthora nicotianae P1976]